MQTTKETVITTKETEQPVKEITIQKGSDIEQQLPVPNTEIEKIRVTNPEDLPKS